MSFLFSPRMFAVLFLVCSVGCGAAVQEETTTVVDQVETVEDQPVTEPADVQTVSLDGELANRFVLADQQSVLAGRLRVSALEVPDSQRTPINLALVVDTSGSMDGEAINHARQASLTLLDLLTDGDRLSFITFSSQTEVLVPSTVLTPESRALIRRQIESIEAQGTTDLLGGLSQGIEQIRQALNNQGINRIVLLSDGVPNDETRIRDYAQSAGSQGISVTALGLGIDFDENLLGMIAQLSGGRFHYIEESADVASVFRDEVLRLERVIARNAVLTLTPGPGVEIQGMVGLQVSRSGRSIHVSLGDLMEGEHRDVIVHLVAPGRRNGAVVELADAVLVCQDAILGRGNIEKRIFLGARSTDDEEQIAEGRNEEIERAAARMQAAALTIEGIQLARGGNIEAAQNTVSRGISFLNEIDPQEEDDEVQAELAEMRNLLGTLPSLVPERPVVQPDAPQIHRGGLHLQGSGGGSLDTVGVAPGRPSAPRPPALRGSPQAERTIRRTHNNANRMLLGN